MQPAIRSSGRKDGPGSALHCSAGLEALSVCCEQIAVQMVRYFSEDRLIGMEMIEYVYVANPKNIICVCYVALHNPAPQNIMLPVMALFCVSHSSGL